MKIDRISNQLQVRIVRSGAEMERINGEMLMVPSFRINVTNLYSIYAESSIRISSSLLQYSSLT